MKTMKKLAAMVVAMAMVIAMVPATAFAEEAEYATIVIENSDTTEVKTLDGNLLADTLETDELGNHICKVGTTLNFTIEAKSGYELMVAYYGFENVEGGFGGTDIPMDETNSYYTILVESVGIYTITPGTIPSESEGNTGGSSSGEAEEMSWEERLMSCFGISAGNNYFAAGQAPNESTIYTYINMNLEE